MDIPAQRPAGLALTLACLALPAAEPTDLVNATLWQQRSVEYHAIAEQTYRQATAALEATLRHCNRRKPAGCAAVAIEQRQQSPAALSRFIKPAVILDLDETALDNARFEGELQRTGDDYSRQQWGRWLEASGRPDAGRQFGRRPGRIADPAFDITGRPHDDRQVFGSLERGRRKVWTAKSVEVAHAARQETFDVQSGRPPLLA